jgi:hypothetical protein
MPKSFVSLTLEQFRELLNKFPFSRKINTVHMHHTWRPNRSEYKGIGTIEAMFDYHTKKRGFSDIAQHVTIAPDGAIWTGRSWNSPPASATGHNGNSTFGPFMFEMIGDFDAGQDTFEDPQRETALQVIVAVQKRFGLPPDALRFHRQMANKTCPGSAIDFAAVVDAVRALHEAAGDSRDAATQDGPFSPAFRDDKLTSADRGIVEAALEALTSGARTGAEPADAELPESAEDVEFTATGGMTSAAAARGARITTADLVALRPHVINLNEGRLTRGGEFFSLPEDVERIFGEDIEKAFSNPQELGMPPRDASQPFRIMIWAHGGLINERAGLGIAHKHLEFWRKNGIYPIYFVWETGFLQTVGQLLRGILPGGARAFFSDNISDPILERTARAAGGEKIWTGMKRNAEVAASADGGATFAAGEFKKFCDRHAGQVEIYAAGHSAGSIFHAHFLPVALNAGIPDVTALYFLAPAIRVDLFRQKLLKEIGRRIKRLDLFTMVREQELADNCASIYRKSLLYLIRFALERDRNAEILGLEESLRRDRDVTGLLNLAGSSGGPGEAIFSPSVPSDGRHATRSITHGGFDDDAPTMNSIALRILGLQQRSQLKTQYAQSRAVEDDPWTVPEVEELQRSFASAVLRPTPVAPAPVGATPIPSTPAAAPAVIRPNAGGARRALCVGIDNYRVRPLAGCIADARLWAQTLTDLRFQCELLLDGNATYSNIKRELEALLRSAKRGDVIVWQYAGHGTQAPDINGDESTGDSPGLDEAICPVDMHTGRLFIDDEIGALIDSVEPGVSFTMFMDCCHSGTINRFGIGEPPGASGRADERSRFIPLTEELKQAYLEFAASQGGARAFSMSRTRNAAKEENEVLFSACLSTEVAWESNGQGEFTVRATRVLRDRGVAVTNEEFINSVVAAFGPNRRQTPNITCAPRLRSLPIVAPLDGSAGRSQDGASASVESRYSGVADALENAARALRSL